MTGSNVPQRWPWRLPETALTPDFGVGEAFAGAQLGDAVPALIAGKAGARPEHH